MKKLMAIAFVASLTAVSCGNNNGDEKESNVMLQEPKVEAMDSTAAVKPADNAMVAPDVPTVKMDSAK